MNAKTIPKPVILGLLALVTLALPAQAQLVWRMSVKFILDANGNRPSAGVVITDQDVRDQIDTANEVLRGTGRGYEFQLTEIRDVPGVSSWFDVSVCASQPALDNAAKAAPGTFLYRNNAINVYINGNNSAGCCSFPNTGEDVIFVGQGSRRTTIFHESGHYLSLYHTQGRSCGSCDNTKTGECHTTPGDDEVADTLPDLACWDQDQISLNWRGCPFDALFPGEQEVVNNVFFNIMSYHNSRTRLTSDQMDHMTDASNGPRFNIASGRTWFVSPSGGCINPDGQLKCHLVFGIPAHYEGGAFSTVAGGVSAANNGDIVLLHAGHYNEPRTYSKPVTFRATRGDVTIGIP